MRPHEGSLPEELRAMVRWVFELESAQSEAIIRPGLSGGILPPRAGPRSTPSGVFLLRASYTDLGGGPVGELEGSTELSVRTRRVEAEHLVSFEGMRRVEEEYELERELKRRENHATKSAAELKQRKTITQQNKKRSTARGRATCSTRTGKATLPVARARSRAPSSTLSIGERRLGP